MSHATYIDEEREFRIGKAEVFSLILVVGLLTFSAIEGYGIYFFLSVAVLSLLLVFYRKGELIRAFKTLKTNKEYIREYKYSRAVKQSRRDKVLFPILFLAPFIALYVFPVPENLFIALGAVAAYPLSNILNMGLILWMERALHGKIYSILEIVEIKEEEDLYVKRFGYKLKEN
ncbi:hypothetical protein [Stygiolobus caldivivus]|uniref:Uncharacterized protein n=1 Tax=Stygiolobus caldivivus TaxID=2824673 RepID=A0A8D5ZFA9_9CREN|nr:hypothetical protein [Stygiolobus caldivivus]BCU70153.1 hypothetical protein KN1_14500 [Stygiolobus caldivivus]